MGADQVIPPNILQEAKGLAIITVLKAGFLFSGRAGSGIIVSRLPDGSWSAPSAIMTAGAGVGGQIGAELTDFVFILNTRSAVESFAQFGSITLGGNVSLAAGPAGRNAEAAGTASLKSAAAIFSYSKTKGLFAGVSLEGSVIVERRDANRKFYGPGCTAKSILSGRVEPPPAVDPLFRVLESRAFTKRQFDADYDDEYYNDIPTSFSDDSSSFDSGIGAGAGGASSRRRATFGSFNRSSDRHGGGTSSYGRGHRGADRSGYEYGDYSDEDDDYYDNNASRRRSNTTNTNFKRATSTSSWEDDVYDRSHGGTTAATSAAAGSDMSPGRPHSSKPKFNDNDIDDEDDPFASARGSKAIALYSFDAEQDGDLSFKKGDVIYVTKKSDSKDDWWSGKCHGKEGIFPANYIELA